MVFQYITVLVLVNSYSYSAVIDTNFVKIELKKVEHCVNSLQDYIISRWFTVRIKVSKPL